MTANTRNLVPIRPLGFYLRMMLITYLVWVTIFLTAGNIAATLPTTDLRSSWDLAIPFWPWMVWIYDFCYLIPLFAVFAIHDGHLLNRLMVAVFTATFTAFVVYFTVPVSYPDPPFGTDLSSRFLEWQFAIDFQPGANKMPSLHVGNSFLVWLAVRKRGKRMSLSFFLGAVIIAGSTLLTKKHLVADVALGAVWAAGAWYLSGLLYHRLFDQSLPPREALLKRLGRKVA